MSEGKKRVRAHPRTHGERAASGTGPGPHPCFGRTHRGDCHPGLVGSCGCLGGAVLQERGEAYLAGAAAAFRAAGIETLPRVVVTPQPPELAIVETAAAEDADLIVMATLPQSAVGRFLFGSVEDKVRRRSPVPVLFVNPAGAGESEV
jgi:hypothetical protein